MTTASLPETVRQSLEDYLSRLDPSVPVDPLQFIRTFWLMTRKDGKVVPRYRLSREQKAMVRSAFENGETIVPSGNALGKDWVTALIILVFFLARNPCRIVLTSVNDKHLAVIWGELLRHIDLCSVTLDHKKGGCLTINSERIRKILPDGSTCKISYIVNMVCKDDTVEAMLGHHATPDTLEEAELKVPLTMAVTDESSGIRSQVVTNLKTWAKRLVMIGNCWPCDDYFRWAVEGFPGSKDRGGDIPRESGIGFARKIIRIRACDSPNVRYALAQIALGLKRGMTMKEITSDPAFAPEIVPGMRRYEDYIYKLDTLDEIKAAAELHAYWYKGAALLLYPPKTLSWCQTLHDQLSRTTRKRRALAIGIDTAEGGDSTVFTAGDNLGVMEQESLKTPDTSIVIPRLLAFGKMMGVSPANWVFDRGGGGHIYACDLRKMGHPVRTIAFGNPPSTTPPKKSPKRVTEKIEQHEDKTVYETMRVELYWEFALACDPVRGGYAIPARFTELLRQMESIPRQYDKNGIAWLPPKSKKNKESKEKTLIEIVGCSPDELESTILMHWGVKHRLAGGYAASNPVPSSYDGYVPR